jgi:hypothetical protein
MKSIVSAEKTLVNEVGMKSVDAYHNVVRNHGTRVLSVLAGQWDNGKTGEERDHFRGIAPGSSYSLAPTEAKGVRFSDATFKGYEEMFRLEKLDVLTTSVAIEGNYYAPITYDYSKSIQDRGVVMITSAGNRGKENMFTTRHWARSPFVLAVGSAINPRQYQYTMQVTAGKETVLYNAMYRGEIVFKETPTVYSLYKNLEDYAQRPVATVQPYASVCSCQVV